MGLGGGGKDLGAVKVPANLNSLDRAFEIHPKPISLGPILQILQDRADLTVMHTGIE